MGKVKNSKENKEVILLISLFFLYHLIKGNFFTGTEIFDNLYSYFGIFYYLLIIYPILIYYSFSIKDSKRRMVLKTRLFFTVLFLFFCALLIVDSQMKQYNLSGIEFEKQFLKTAWVENNLGGYPSMFMDLLYFDLERKYMYITSGVVILFSSYVLFAGSIVRVVRRIKKFFLVRKERKQLINREKELENKISIKESLEKNMLLKKEKYLQEKEHRIREQVKEVLQEEAEHMEEKVEKPSENSDRKIEETPPNESGDKVKISSIIKQAKIKADIAHEEKNKL